MIDISLNPPDIFEKLAREFSPESIRAASRRGMSRAVLYVQQSVPPYPSPPATSTYRRTGTLGRSTTTAVRDEADGVTGIIGNNVEYAPYVIGRETQAWMHVGRWWTLEAVVEQQGGEIAEIISNEIRSEFGL